jgi:hypothetical protein
MLETENQTEKKIGAAEIPVLICVSGYTSTDCLRDTTVRIVLQILDLEERIQDYKNKWHDRNLRMDSSRLNPKIWNYQQMDE